MQTLRQLGNGFLLGVLSIALVLGAFALALAEGGLVTLPAASPTASPVFPTLLPTLPLLSTQAAQNGLPLLTASPIASLTLTPPPPPTTCPPPPGWQAVLVQPYDTLDSLAALYRVPAAQLQQVNCLVSTEISAGAYIYVPPQATITAIPCGAPFGWVIYSVQPGDTLYRIGLLYRVSVGELQRANCLGASTYIYTNQQLRVPNVPVSTATFTAIVSATASATETGAPPTLSASDTPLPTETPSPLPTETAPPTLEPSITPTP